MLRGFGVHIDALPGATLVAKHKHFCELDASSRREPSIFFPPATGYMLMLRNR